MCLLAEILAHNVGRRKHGAAKKGWMPCFGLGVESLSVCVCVLVALWEGQGGLSSSEVCHSYL